MFARILMVTLVAFSLSACTMVFKSNGGKKIANFDDRSVVYAWINMEEAGSNIDSATLERIKPVTEERYYRMGVIRREGGYILYHIGVPKGVYKLTAFTGHGCLVSTFFLCDAGTLYDIPKQGSQGGAVVKAPGTYFLGALRYKSFDKGFFNTSTKFDLEEDKDAPSQREMLQAIHDRLNLKYPQQMKRIRPLLATKG